MATTTTTSSSSIAAVSGEEHDLAGERLQPAAALVDLEDGAEAALAEHLSAAQAEAVLLQAPLVQQPYGQLGEAAQLLQRLCLLIHRHVLADGHADQRRQRIIW